MTRFDTFSIHLENLNDAEYNKIRQNLDIFISWSDFSLNNDSWIYLENLNEEQYKYCQEVLNKLFNTANKN